MTWTFSPLGVDVVDCNLACGRNRFLYFSFYLFLGMELSGVVSSWSVYRSSAHSDVSIRR